MPHTKSSIIKYSCLTGLCLLITIWLSVSDKASLIRKQSIQSYMYFLSLFFIELPSYLTYIANKKT